MHTFAAFKMSALNLTRIALLSAGLALLVDGVLVSLAYMVVQNVCQ